MLIVEMLKEYMVKDRLGTPALGVGVPWFGKVKNRWFATLYAKIS